MQVELQKFVTFHTDNPQVYDFFKYFTRVAIEKGHDRLSPWLVMNRVRWETSIETKAADGFKISNHNFAYYSRMFMYDHPSFKGFFRTKTMKNEYEIANWLDKSRGNYPMTKHSNLGASGMHRWGPCPGSVHATKDYPRTSNVYAAEGTCAHDVADKCLSTDQDAEEWLNTAMTVEGFDFTVGREMVNGVQMYLDLVRSDAKKMKAKKIHSEMRVDLSKVHPGCFGTNDAALISGKKLKVYDLKYGRGVVEAEDNAQLLYYAVGVLLKLDPKREVEEIEMIIVQPRVSDPIKRWTVSRAYMKKWIKVLKAAAEATVPEDAPRIPGEKQCQWCDHKPNCPEAKALAFEKVGIEFDDDGDMVLPDVEEMGDNSKAEAMHHFPFLKSWMASIETDRLRTLEAGGKVEGFKLVDKRATRKWKDGVTSTLQGLEELGLEQDEMFESKLLSPTQMEKLLAKEDRKAMSDLTESKSSGTKMVPESDPAPAVSAGAVSDFADD